MNIALICAPFASVDRPSLGLSILSSHAKSLGHTSDVLYLNIDYVEQFGLTEYQEMANGSATELEGEVLLSEIWSHPPEGRDKQQAEIAQWFEDRARELAAKPYDIYGFSCLFQQVRASLWLAECIKKIKPEAVIVFGGAALDYPMGEQLFNCYDQIDYLFMGESEQTFTDFLNAMEMGEPLNHPSVLSRQGIGNILTSYSILADVNESMEPDYDDYFRRFNQSVLSMLIKPFIFYESSRGCSWGQKKQCVFCGLNGGTIGYRNKRPEKALQEIRRLIEDYGDYVDEIAFVDNIIPESYYKEFLPDLAQVNSGHNYFYEIKANARYQHLLNLKKASVLRIQPGIESLSTHILKCMSKGVTALQNISLLVNSRQLGLSVDWNILLNIPGETDEAVSEMLKVIPMLRHLDPPDASSPFRLDRHSPVFVEPDKFSITEITPASAYFSVFPELEDEQVFNLAYHFEFRDQRSENRVDLHKKVQSEIDVWKTGEYTLTHSETDDGMFEIRDTRSSEAKQYFLSSGESRVYSKLLQEKDSMSISKFEHQEQALLGQLISKNLVFTESGRALALSLEA